MEWLDPVVFSGKCHYACITEPNTKFEPVWSILVEVDDDNRKTIEGANLTISNKDDIGDFVRLKRKVFKQDGTKKTPPKVVDSQNNPWNSDKKIANGSTVTVKVTPFKYDGNSSRPAGISANLDAVQIVNFIEYQSQDFAPVNGGYVQETEEVPF